MQLQRLLSFLPALALATFPAATLACPGLSAGDELETTAMVRFPAMEQLDVQWVSPQNQGGARLTSGQSSFPASR